MGPWAGVAGVGSALLLVGCALHLFLVNDLSAGQIAAWLRKPTKIQYEDVGQMDTDVADEAARAADTGSDGVRVHHLRKVYPTGQVAEAPWSGAEWAVALRFDHPRATVLVCCC